MSTSIVKHAVSSRRPASRPEGLPFSSHWHRVVIFLDYRRPTVSTAFRRLVVMAGLALIPLAALVAGCGTGEPKLADAPEFKAAPEEKAQPIPGRAATYGGSTKYKEAMDKQDAARK